MRPSHTNREVAARDWLRNQSPGLRAEPGLTAGTPQAVLCSTCTVVWGRPALPVFRASESSCLRVGGGGRRGPTVYTHRTLFPRVVYLGRPVDREALNLKEGVGPLDGKAWFVRAPKDLVRQQELNPGVVGLLDCRWAALAGRSLVPPPSWSGWSECGHGALGNGARHGQVPVLAVLLQVPLRGSRAARCQSSSPKKGTFLIPASNR